MGLGAVLSRKSRRNQKRRNGANGENSGSGIVDILWKILDEVVGIKCKLRYDLALHNPLPLPTSSESALKLNLWTGRSNPRQTLHAINDVAQGYLPRKGYQ